MGDVGGGYGELLVIHHCYFDACISDVVNVCDLKVFVHYFFRTRAAFHSPDSQFCSNNCFNVKIDCRF